MQKITIEDLAQPTATPDKTTGRTLILNNAARLFRTKGYAATSLRDLAAACNMKAGSIYYHFESKDAIVAEVLRIGVAQVYEEVRRVTTELGEQASSDDLIYAAVLAHLKSLHDSIDYTSANIRIFGQVPPEVRQTHLPLRTEYEGYWQRLIEQCNQKGAFSSQRNLRLASFFLLGLMNSTLEWFQPNKTSIADIGLEITTIFIHGMGDTVNTSVQHSQ
ncbi:TetR/AcrR family transcriptional regulator [Allopusillimonas ginsengisoli]|nr:TetR/AcrR family transcriptional regulator [Allopusillimonas ginsengisoli]